MKGTRKQFIKTHFLFTFPDSRLFFTYASLIILLLNLNTVYFVIEKETAFFFGKSDSSTLYILKLDQLLFFKSVFKFYYAFNTNVAFFAFSCCLIAVKEGQKKKKNTQNLNR